MPIETRRPRKGKRLTIVQPMCGDLKDIVAGCGFDRETGKAMLVLGELSQPLMKEMKGMYLSLQHLTEEGNAVVIFIQNIESCNMLISKLNQMKIALSQNRHGYHIPESTHVELID